MRFRMFELFCILFIGAVVFAPAVNAGEVPVAISEDGGALLKTTESRQGLAVVDTVNGEQTLIAETLGAGNYASFSPDGGLVCYKKVLVAPDGARLFVPVIYSIATGKSIALAKPTDCAGTPAVSANGRIAFTLGNTLLVLDKGMKTLATLDLGHHVNLLAISPVLKTSVSFRKFPVPNSCFQEKPGALPVGSVMMFRVPPMEGVARFTALSPRWSWMLVAASPRPSQLDQ